MNFTRPHYQSDMITSTSNPRIKNFLKLKKARERNIQQLFVVEGVKEIHMALDAGYSFSDLFYCPKYLDPGTFKNIIEKTGPKAIIGEITAEIYQHIAYRKTSEGLIGWATPKNLKLENLKLASNPLLLVLERVEKPGNLGAILRTADAAGLDAVIVADPKTDIYNPNVIRSSLGAIFTVPVAVEPNEEVIKWLKSNHIRIFCASLGASKSYDEIDYTKPSAIVMGTEASGLSEQWLTQSELNLVIPMFGNVDSMNVSVSAGIIIFEAIRQRKNKV